MKATFALLALLSLSPVMAQAQATAASPSPEASPVPVAADAAPDPTPDGEPLPAGAPTQPYELAAWCYGAMDQYLYIYRQILPQLRDIDHLFGTSVKDEPEPYADDMAAAQVELGVLKNAVQSAEKASLKVISPDGARAVSLGRGIWGPAETHTRRELARAWLSWALPDRCDTNARELAAKSSLLGQALKYNGPSATESPPAPVKIVADDGDNRDTADESAGERAKPDSTPDAPMADGAPKPEPTPDAAATDSPAKPDSTPVSPVVGGPANPGPTPSAQATDAPAIPDPAPGAPMVDRPTQPGAAPDAPAQKVAPPTPDAPPEPHVRS